MWIERDISSLIKQIYAERPVLLLTGTRQTGKSSLLNRFLMSAWVFRFRQTTNNFNLKSEKYAC